MEATDILSNEHQVILRVIAALECAAQKLESGQAVRPAFFLDAADFIKGFADGCHHQKEEGVLFKRMVENGMPKDSGPIAVMLSEHEQGRAFTRAMREAAILLQAGNNNAVPSVVKNARDYAALLKEHIYKEDNVLFPMAERVIPLEQQVNVTMEFDHIEHEETGTGVHEKYLTLAEKLEKEM